MLHASNRSQQGPTSVCSWLVLASTQSTLRSSDRAHTADQALLKSPAVIFDRSSPGERSSLGRRHQPRTQPLAKIRPGRPAPVIGAGIGSASTVAGSSQTLFQTYGIYLSGNGGGLAGRAVPADRSRPLQALPGCCCGRARSALQVRERASCLMSSKA
jgi:hypothetical protein